MQARANRRRAARRNAQRIFRRFAGAAHPPFRRANNSTPPRGGPRDSRARYTTWPRPFRAPTHGQIQCVAAHRKAPQEWMTYKVLENRSRRYSDSRAGARCTRSRPHAERRSNGITSLIAGLPSSTGAHLRSTTQSIFASRCAARSAATAGTVCRISPKRGEAHHQKAIFALIHCDAARGHYFSGCDGPLRLDSQPARRAA